MTKNLTWFPNCKIFRNSEVIKRNNAAWFTAATVVHCLTCAIFVTTILSLINDSKN